MNAGHSGTGPLLLTWGALMALLACTIGATFLPLGPFMPAVNLAIAFAKSALVFWVFMHLRELGGLVRLAATGAAAWILILFLLTGADYLTR